MQPWRSLVSCSDGGYYLCRVSGRLRSGIRSRNQDAGPDDHSSRGPSRYPLYASKQKLIMLSRTSIYCHYLCYIPSCIRAPQMVRYRSVLDSGLGIAIHEPLWIKRWSPTFNCTASWGAHEGIVLSSIITHSAQSDAFVLVSGANDGFVKVTCHCHSSLAYITFLSDLGH